jgi:hypothetical protein
MFLNIITYILIPGNYWEVEGRELGALPGCQSRKGLQVIDEFMGISFHEFFLSRFKRLSH